MNNVVFYCDGSCRPTNLHYSGYGIYGYTYTQMDNTDKTRQYSNKHPIHPRYYTTKGMSKVKDTELISVTSIIEGIYAIDKSNSTNNEAEIAAVLRSFTIASKIENLKSIRILTDSNYVVTCFNDNLDKWANNAWRKQDNKPIVHLEDWLKIYVIKQNYASIGVELIVEWVKGHAEDTGNYIADLYSIIGSNAASVHTKDSTDTTCIYERISTMQEYKNTYTDRDIVYHFKDLFFSSEAPGVDDASYCFICSTEASIDKSRSSMGGRNTNSIFAVNIGYVPESIIKFKEFFRSLSRAFLTTCCIKLSRLDNKELYRLAHLIDLKYLLVAASDKSRLSYTLVGDDTPFIFDIVNEYPFITTTNEMYKKLMHVGSTLPNSSDIVKCICEGVYSIDITETIVKSNKLILTNNDKYLDYSDTITNSTPFKVVQKAQICIGKDIPNYAILKKLESTISKIYLIIEKVYGSSLSTIYTYIVTTERKVLSMNIDNKYLIL